MSVFETINQGTPGTNATAWPVELTDGTNILGTPTHPVKTDPTGTTTQPVSGTVAVSGVAGTVAVTESGTWTVTATQPTAANLNVTAAQPTAANLNATAVQGGTWTHRNQDGSGNALTSTSGALDNNIKTIGGTAPSTGTGVSGAGIPRVTVSNDSAVKLWNGTNTLAVDSTGAANANITEVGGFPLSLGQKTMSQSLPVAFSSDQTLTVNVGAVYNNQTGTISSGAVPTTAGGALTILSGVFTWSTLVLNFVPSGTISFGGEFQVEGSIDSINWTPLTGTLLSSNPQQITQYLSTNFSMISARYNLAGFPYVRIHTIAGFSGTINVEYALTTALGDETSFSKTELIDASGAAVTLPTPTQYTDGAMPSGVLYQSGSTTFTAVADGNQWMASPVYVLPKSPVIGDTLVVALVAFGPNGTSLTTAKLSGMSLVDSNNISYAPAALYDCTTTKFGEAVILFTVPVTQLDSENNLGFIAVCSAICPTSLSIFAHELQNVSIGTLSCGHTTGSSGSSLTPLASAVGNFPVTLLVTQTSGNLQPIVPAYAQSQFVDSAYWGITGSSFNAITYGSVTNQGYDLFAVAAPIVSKGTLMMGQAFGTAQFLPLNVSTTGVLNTSTTIVGTVPVAASQSGTWTMTNPSVGSTGSAVPTSATLVGTKGSTGNLTDLLSDTSGNLLVNIAAGGVSSNAAAAATAAVVPAAASYTGINIAGNLVGQTGLSLTNSKAAAVAIVDANGNQITSFGGGTQYIQNGVSTTPTGTVAMGLCSSNNGIEALSVDTTGHLNANIINTPSVTVSGTPSVTISGSPTITGTVKNQDGSGNALTSTSGALNVNVTGGATSGTQYVAGAAAATPTGTVAMGWDGTDVRAISTTTTGIQNVTGTVALSAPVGITGSTGSILDATQGAAAPANILQVGGVYNSTAPTLATGKLTALQTDIAGDLKVSLAATSVTLPVSILSGSTALTNTSGALNVTLQSGSTALTNTSGALNVNVTNSSSGSNAAASATGSAVPANAGYTGVINPSGNLVGLPGYTDEGVAGSTGTQIGVMGMMLQQSGGNYAWAERCDANGSHIVTPAPSTYAVCTLSSQFINVSGAAICIKASAGNLYGLSLYSIAASPIFVEFFNVASAPTLGTSTVVFSVVIPASGSIVIPPYFALMNFSTGIGFAVTTAQGGTSTSTAVTGMIFYK